MVIQTQEMALVKGQTYYVTTCLMDIKKMIKEYYEHLHVHRFDKLDVQNICEENYETPMNEIKN